jgi:hypothetical protein
MPDLGSSNQPVPMPRDFTGGPDKFGVVRVIDGHKTFALGEQGRNVYYPNGDPDASSETGEVSYDFSPEEY